MPSDPYQVLGVSSRASDAEVRSAYRKLVQLHHPDHNNGSVQSARKFEEVQEAYSQVVAMRKGGSGWAQAPRRRSSAPPPPPPVDSDLEARLAEIERKLREANARHAKARREAREAAAAASGHKRPSDEELGYYSTDDTFSKILADARAEFSDRVEEARGHPVTKRAADLLDELAAKLRGERPEP
jgi:hypothetical protein